MNTRLNNQIFLGNDIVDLQSSDARGKYRNLGFIQRVFTPEEQKAIKNFPEPDLLLWSLWSAKEASYKAFKKYMPQGIFSPKQFFLSAFELHQLINSEQSVLYGCLRHSHLQFNLQWQRTSDYLHCTAVLTNCLDPFKNWQEILLSIETTSLHLSREERIKHFSPRELQNAYSHESVCTRFYAKKLLSRTGIPQPIEILRVENKAPELYAASLLQTDIELSMSHDERYCATVAVKINAKDFHPF